MNFLSILFCLFIMPSLSFAHQKIIYGDDNRQDWFEVKDEVIKQQALSVAAMIPKQNLIAREDYYLISSLSLRGRGICLDEPFVSQLTAATCSGFLVGEDLILTAATCLNDQQDCQNHQWVFDYRLKFSNDKTSTVDNKHVYGCKKILERKNDPRSLENYTLIQLDRKVEDRVPLKLNIRGSLYRQSALYSIGHPSGLPVKITHDAVVKTIYKKYFRANIDSFLESNGSPVFNEQTGLVEGIMASRHQQDYISNSGCQRLNRQGQNQGLGEVINFIGNVNYLRNLNL
jgi:V8-like Glu-specific endopeptidase